MTSLMIAALSLRMVNSTSMPPICGVMSNLRLTMPACPASVGLGFASSSAKRLLLKFRRGMLFADTEPPLSAPGRRPKYPMP
jgi:hypothetical protein